MPPVLDLDAPALVDLRPAVIKKPRCLGERSQRVERAERGGCLLNPAHRVRRHCPQAVEDFEFERPRALIGAEDFALDLLEFRRHETLAVDRRLLPGVVAGHAGEVGFGDLDEIPEDGIEADLERLDAGALDLALLEAGDPILALARGRAQFVERGVAAGADHAAVAHDGGRLIDDRVAQRAREIRQRVEAARELGEQLRARLGEEAVPAGERLDARAHAGRLLERGGERGKVARVARAAAQPRRGALDVANAAERVAQLRERKRVPDKLRHDRLPRADRPDVAQRVQEPFAQGPRAHRRHRAIERAEQRHRPTAARLDEFKVRLGDGIDDEEFADAVGPQAAEVGDVAPHLAGEVVEDRAGRANGRAHSRAAKAIERLDFEMLAQEKLRRLALEGVALDRVQSGDSLECLLLRRENFRRRNARQFVVQRGGVVEFGEAEFAGAQVGEGEAEAPLALADGGEVILPALVEAEIIERAGAQDLRKLAPHEFAGLDLADLVADGHAFAGGDEFFDVALHRVVGHAAHRSRAAPGERDIQNAGGFLRVVAKHFVEIAQPEEQERVGRQLLPHGKILPHHGRRLIAHACPPSDERMAEIGLVAEASSPRDGSPASTASRAHSTAIRNALAIRTGSPAAAIAVFTSTASAPISIASAAWLGAPMPASTTTGTVACLMMISICARVSIPRLLPIGEPSGITVAAPTS